jgi:ABC-type multidrug transport system ATPase subunit
LDDHRAKRVRQLSKGNLQRLGLGQAMLCDVEVIVLDEPTHGLDPVWTQRFRDIVTSLRRPDRAILIASHNLDELSRVADRVGIIDRGRLHRIVDVRATTQRDAGESTPYRIVVARGEELVAQIFPGARAMGQGEHELGELTLDALNAGLMLLVQRGALLSAVHPMHSVLEQQFRDVVGATEEPK